MTLLHIINFFIIGSIILFILAYLKLKNTSISLVNYLHSFKIFNVISSKTTDIGVILIISCLHIALFIYFNIIGNVFNFLDFLSYSYDLNSLIKVIHIVIFFYSSYLLISILVFSVFTLHTKLEEIQKHYFVSKLHNSKSNIYRFMETYMSYNSINNAKEVMNKKYLDEILKNQLMLIDSFSLESIFNKSTPKEIIKYAKTIEELLCILKIDYIDNKSFLRKRKSIEKKLNQFNF